MEYIEWVGILAGFFTTVAFFPQARKTWRSKSASDLSLSMFLIFVTGVVLWLIYGILIGNLPIVLWNVATFILAASILYFKLKYK